MNETLKTMGRGDSPRSIKKSRAKSSGCSSDEGHGKNPYSTIGLDKFSALLSDFEEKKKNIYLRRDSRDMIVVRFVYSGSEKVIPVIVKSKVSRQKQGAVGQKKDVFGSWNDANKQAGAMAERVKAGLTAEPNDKKIVTAQIRRMTREMNKRKLGWPYYYVPIFLVFILHLLAIF